MFDFKNLNKKLYFKNNMSKGKMTGMEKQTLISFYEDNVDPYYRNKVKRYLIKVKLVTLFEANFQKSFWIMLLLFRNITDLRNEKTAVGNESKSKFYKDFDFLLG